MHSFSGTEKSDVLVSILIPTCNQESFIARAVQSALDQTYSQCEIIVGDDSDTDASEKIIREQFAGKVTYLHHKPGKGRVKNYHDLLYEMAKGDWVINLDGDDYFENPDFIKDAVSLARKHPEAAFVFAKQRVFQETADRFISLPNRHIEGKTLINGNWLFLNAVFRNIEIPHLGTMYNRKQAMSIGFYESEIPSSDRESLLKLAINNKVLFLNSFSGVWVKHGNNLSAKLSVSDMIANLSMYDRLFDYARKHSSMSCPALRFWRLWAKYKSSYARILQFIKDKNLSEFRNFRRNLRRHAPLVFFLQFFDFRIYLKRFTG